MRPAAYFFNIQLSNSRAGNRQLQPMHALPILYVLSTIYKKLNIFSRQNPVFDSWKKKKSLYPLYLLGYGDFLLCHEI